MQPEQVKLQLEAQLSECEFQVTGDGSHFEIVAIGEVFEGLNAVKKQQVIYGALNDKIADGSIHAVVIKTFTPGEWAAQ